MKRKYGHRALSSVLIISVAAVLMPCMYSPVLARHPPPPCSSCGTCNACNHSANNALREAHCQECCAANCTVGGIDAIQQCTLAC